MSEKSVFEVFSNVNVIPDSKDKNGFRYLSWASAVEKMLKQYPNAKWDFTKWNDQPFLKTDLGYFVEAVVEINNVVRKQYLPVFDFRNKAIQNPTVMDINKSMQRALAKAIACHGLGLQLFVNEDLPLTEREATQEAREYLHELLKLNGALTKEYEQALPKMKYDDLIVRINSYKEKMDVSK